MTSALFQLSSDNGATFSAAGTALAGSNALAYGSSGTYAIKARLDSTAGVENVLWSITSADDVTLGAGSLPSTPTASDLSCSFSIPKTAATYLLQARLVTGQNAALTGAPDEIVSVRGVKVKTAAGLELAAVGETTEGDPSVGWLRTLNAIARGGGGAAGAKRLVVPVLHALAQTNQPSSSPQVASAFTWDPALYIPSGVSGATVTLKAILSTSDPARACNIDLYRVTGATAGALAGSPLSSVSLTEEEKTIDVTSALTSAPAGVFRLRQWMSNPSSGQAALVSNARLEVAWS